MVLLFSMQPRFKILYYPVLLLLLLSAAVCYAENTEPDPVLFINSNPINARVFVDGEPIPQETPALLRGLKPGKHTVRVHKDGFSPADETVILTAGEISVYSAELSRGMIIADFPDEEEIVLAAGNPRSLPPSFRMPEGEYSFSRKGGSLELRPIYPKESLLTVNSTLFAAAFAVNTFLTAIELKEEGELFLPQSPQLVVSEAATAVLGMTGIALLIDKNSWTKSFKLYDAGTSGLDSDAEELYAAAQNLLSRGIIDGALSGFSSLISGYPDFSRFPEILYKTARLHIITGDTKLAEPELNIIINKFPDPEIYDKACQTLALLYYNSGNISASTGIVSRMVFLDPLFSRTRAEIDSKGVEAVLENWVQNPERQAF